MAGRLSESFPNNTTKSYYVNTRNKHKCDFLQSMGIIDLFTVSDAILVGGQTRLKSQCMYGRQADGPLGQERNFI